MAAKDSYDVLRLIGHGKNSYVSSENVMGTPLIYWLKYHPHLEKSAWSHIPVLPYHTVFYNMAF